MLVAAGAKRWPTISGVPTLKELGYDVDMTVWWSLAAPAGLAKAQLNIIYDAFKAAHSDPGVLSMYEKLYATAPYTSGEELKKLWIKKQAEAKPLVEAIMKENEKKK